MSTRVDAAAEVVITPAVLRKWPLPNPGASKHSRGHVMVVGGGASTPGAALLSGLAALRVGAGVLALAVEHSVAAALAVAIPEASVLGVDFKDVRAADEWARRIPSVDALALGPGLDDPATTRDLLVAITDVAPDSLPIVLDAFALGVLGELDDRVVRRALPAQLVLTPNPDEARRLLGDRSDADLEDPAAIAGALAGTFDAVVAYQRHIADPGGGRWIVSGGNPGLGTAGSGDVLAGAITGLLARGATASQAACWATYMHATAGDRLVAQIGPVGYLARELLPCFPSLLAELRPLPADG